MGINNRRSSGAISALRMKKMIEIKDAVVYIGRKKVFNGLSLDISAGDNTVIIGPNGAGKSTLLKLLSLDIFPVYRRGSYVRLFGRECWNVWELRSHIGIVSHELHHRYMGSALGLDVLLSGYYAGIDTWPHQTFSPKQRKKALRIMKMLGVPDLGRRAFSAMSAGEQRRFLLGRALINGPDALVLDEPTSGLDLKACFQYIEIIRGLISKGKTLILTTHHIHEIPPEVSRVILLKGGRIIADGRKEDVLTEKNLRDLFGVKITLVRKDGFYQAMPALF
jgi:iron complex transport system ATP-binding protein